LPDDLKSDVAANPQPEEEAVEEPRPDDAAGALQHLMAKMKEIEAKLAEKDVKIAALESSVHVKEAMAAFSPKNREFIEGKLKGHAVEKQLEIIELFKGMPDAAAGVLPLKVEQVEQVFVPTDDWKRERAKKMGYIS